MHPFLPVTCAVAALAGLAVVPGCEKSTKHLPPDTVGSRSQPLDVPEMAWPFWPERMRIHPLSYIVEDPTSGQTLVEARLEFFDPDGHTTRVVGATLVEMRDASNLFNNDTVVWWEQDMTDLALNARFFDDVTRTYLLRLEIKPHEIPRRPQLHVQFRSADGRVFEADYELPERRVEQLPAPDGDG